MASCDGGNLVIPTLLSSISQLALRSENDQSRDQIVDYAQLSDEVLGNITELGVLANSPLLFELVSFCKLPNLTSLCLSLSTSIVDGARKPNLYDFGQVLAHMPNLTSLQIIGLDNEPRSQSVSVFSTIKRPFQLPNLKHLDISGDLMASKSMEALCQYASFPALTTIHHPPIATESSEKNYATMDQECQAVPDDQLLCCDVKGAADESTIAKSPQTDLAQAAIASTMIQWFESMPNLSQFLPSVVLQRGHRDFVRQFAESVQLAKLKVFYFFVLTEPAHRDNLTMIIDSKHLTSLDTLSIHEMNTATTRQLDLATIRALFLVKPWLGSITTLRFMSIGFNDEMCEIIGRSYVTNLKTFELLKSDRISANGLTALLHSPILQGLTTLQFGMRGLFRDDSMVHALTSSPYLGNLESLKLSHTSLPNSSVTSKSLLHFATASSMTKLKEIDTFSLVLSRLQNTPSDNANFITFVQSPNIAHLTKLDLSPAKLSFPALQALAESVNVPSIVELVLGTCGDEITGINGDTVTDQKAQQLEFFASLCQNHHWSNLQVLDLKKVQVTDFDLKHLTECQYLANLRSLKLSSPNITDDGLKLIAESPYFAGLEKLTLSGTSITDIGIQHLSRSPYITNLKHLKLLDHINLTTASLDHLFYAPQLFASYHSKLTFVMHDVDGQIERTLCRYLSSPFDLIVQLAEY